MPDEVIAGHLTHWRIVGSGPRKALMLHCSLAHGGAWAAVAEHLGDMLTMTIPDLPSHGRSAHWDGSGSLHDLSTEIATEIAKDLAAATGPVDLIGHSFGATVALRLALQEPDLARSLTLVEPVLFAAARVAGAPQYHDFAASDLAFRETLVNQGPTDAAAMFHRLWGNAVAFSDLPAPQRTYMSERIGLIPTANATLNEDKAGLLRPGRMENLHIPVCLIEGDNSMPVMSAINDAISRRMPNAERVIVPGAGHMVPITHPAEVARAIRKTLAR